MQYFEDKVNRAWHLYGRNTGAPPLIFMSPLSDNETCHSAGFQILGCPLPSSGEYLYRNYLISVCQYGNSLDCWWEDVKIVDGVDIFIYIVDILNVLDIDP